MSRIQRLLHPKVAPDSVTPLVAIVPALLLVAILGVASLSAAAPKPLVTTGEPVEMQFSQIKVKHQPEPPAYPPEAKEQRIQGTVVVILTIDTEGKATDCWAESGPEELRACAVGYARAWEFEPAMVNGKVVEARFKLTMPFRLR